MVRRAVAPVDQPSAWDVDPDAFATPGETVLVAGSGLRISEWSDASGTGNFVYEMVELGYRP